MSKDKVVSYKKHIEEEEEEEEEDRDTSSSSDYGLLSFDRLNLGPRKKVLLVLGLGGLLCHRVHRYTYSSVPRFRKPDASYGSMLVYKRPHCEEFMKFCMERFVVGVWSSAKEWYLNDALDCIVRGLKSKLLFTWDQNECTNSGFFTLEKSDKPLFLKDLKKLWGNTSICKGKFSSSNTLLIDDKPYKALLNPSNTAIFPDEYTSKDKCDDDLGKKGKIRIYLENLADASEDVQSYVKKNPFGQEAITSHHSDWDYYSKVVRSFRVD